MTDLINRDDALKPCPFCGCELEEPFINVLNTYRHPDNEKCFANRAIIYPETLAAWNTRALPAVDLETCGKCMGSGYGGHPDSGTLCFDCNGTGGVPSIDPAAIREAALREAYEVVYKWWFGDGNALPQELILALIKGETK